MSNTVSLQTPVDRSLFLEAKKEARKHGFRSLQELVNLFVVQVAKNGLSINIGFDENLSIASEKKLNLGRKKVEKEIEDGEAEILSSAEEVMASLN